MSVPEKAVGYVETKSIITVRKMSADLDISIVSAQNYLSRLSREKKLIRIGKGVYKLSTSGTRLEVTMEVERIQGLLCEKYPTLKFVIWSLRMLANYAHYEVGKDLIVVEVEKGLGYRIKDTLAKEGYIALLNPGEQAYRDFAYYNYIFVNERAERFGVRGYIPEPERLLVDVYFSITRKMLNFSAYEYGVIIGNALRMGDINIRKMLTYSSRRGVNTELNIILYEVLKQRGLPVDELFKKKSYEVINEIISGAIEDE